MNEGEKLTAILGVIGKYWDKVTSELKEDQLIFFKQELLTLETKMKTAKNFEEINEASRYFFEMVSKLEHLKFLTDVYDAKMRGGDLPEAEEEIRIKIINYCIMFKEKIIGPKNE